MLAKCVHALLADIVLTTALDALNLIQNPIDKARDEVMGTIQDFGAVLKKLRQVGFQDIVLVGGREVVGPRLLGGNIEGDFIAEET